MSDTKKVETPEVHTEWLLGGNPNAIEAQEAAGQKSLARSSQLPIVGSPGSPRFGELAADVETAWRKTGIDFGPVKDGELFRDAALPDGWEIKPTDHSMWSDLVDDIGRIRASIFYKAAFYDRDAFMELLCRFRIRKLIDPGRNYRDARDLVYEVLDCGGQVFVSEPIRIEAFPGHDDEPKRLAWLERDRMANKAAEAECEAWLKEHGFEDYKNPGVYWS